MKIKKKAGHRIHQCRDRAPKPFYDPLHDPVNQVRPSFLSGVIPAGDQRL